MTDRVLLDPEQNFAYYRNNMAYRDSPARLQEARIQWAVGRIAHHGSKTVLDIGCTDGFFAQVLSDGVEYLGIELNEFSSRRPYPRAVGKITCGNAATMDLPKGPWDCIFIGEILEHLPEPADMLRRAAEVLSPSGIIISTSAAGHGEAQEPGNDEHLREWTPEEFTRLHESAGLEVVEQGLATVYATRLTNCVVAKKAKVGQRNDERAP